MVEKVSSQQAYVDYVMKNLPDAQRGDIHVMKSGDNLWNLAKTALNKKNASNKEISDYMLLIAKLNNLDTIEKMNGLKISDKIYMPKTNSAPTSETSNKIEGNKKAASSVKSASAPDKAVVSTVDSIKKEKEMTSAEKSLLGLKETLLNDPTVFVEKAYPRFINLYHVYHHYKDPDNIYYSRKRPLLSFNMDNEGNIKTISFNDEKRINSIRYDYDMDANGNIALDSYSTKIPVDKLDKKELDEIHQILRNISKQAENTY